MVRAFAGWPGTRAKVQVVNSKDGQDNTLELKIITTRVSDHCVIQGDEVDDVSFFKGALIFPCGGCTTLEVSSYYIWFTIYHRIEDFIAFECVTNTEQEKSGVIISPLFPFFSEPIV